MHLFKAADRRLPVLLLVLLLFTFGAAQADEEKAGYLGVMLQDLSPSMAKALQVDDAGGVLVDDVVKDSPAAAAGLKDGDVIIEFNGLKTANGQALTKAVRSAAPGDEVKVVVLREGKKKTLKVEVGEREIKTADVMFFSDDGQVTELHGHQGGNVWFDESEDGHKVIIKKMMDGQHDMSVFTLEDRGFMGIVPQDLDEQLGDYFGVKNGEGVLVASVTDDSGAAKAGLKAGDVIVRIGDNDIDSTTDLHEAMSGTEVGQELEIQIRREGKDKAVTVTLGEMPEMAVQENIFFGHGGNEWTAKAPKMMLHGAPHAQYKVMRRHGDGDIDIEVIRESDAELQEMKKDLDEMRKQIEEMKKELKK